MIQSTYDSWLSTDPDSFDEVVAVDIYGNDIYSDTLIYDTEVGIVKADCMTKFFEEINELNGQGGTVEFFDGTYEDTDLIDDVILYDGYWFTAGETDDFLEFREWSPITHSDL